MDPLVSQAVVEVCTRTGDVKLAEPQTNRGFTADNNFAVGASIL